MADQTVAMWAGDPVWQAGGGLTIRDAGPVIRLAIGTGIVKALEWPRVAESGYPAPRMMPR